MTEITGASSIDCSVLDRIRMLESPGRQGLLEKVIALYLSESQKTFDNIRACVEAGDAEALRRAAHTLKSSSANVGATGVFDLCRKIEEQAAAGSLPSAGDLRLDRLEEEYGAARRDLQAFLGSVRGEENSTA